MDCEGVEYEILYNTPSDYLRRIKIISIEYHDNRIDNIEKLKIFLENNGFKISKPCSNFAVIVAENIREF